MPGFLGAAGGGVGEGRAGSDGGEAGLWNQFGNDDDHYDRANHDDHEDDDDDVVILCPVLTLQHLYEPCPAPRHQDGQGTLRDDDDDFHDADDEDGIEDHDGDYHDDKEDDDDNEDDESDGHDVNEQNRQPSGLCLCKY